MVADGPLPGPSARSSPPQRGNVGETRGSPTPQSSSVSAETRERVLLGSRGAADGAVASGPSLWGAENGDGSAHTRHLGSSPTASHAHPSPARWSKTLSVSLNLHFLPARGRLCIQGLLQAKARLLLPSPASTAHPRPGEAVTHVRQVPFHGSATLM